jgi:hypothetical protein
MPMNLRSNSSTFSMCRHPPQRKQLLVRSVRGFMQRSALTQNRFRLLKAATKPSAGIHAPIQRAFVGSASVAVLGQVF